MTDQVNTRGLALEFLLEVEKGALSHVALRGMLERYQYLDKQERAFLTRPAFVKELWSADWSWMPSSTIFLKCR